MLDVLKSARARITDPNHWGKSSLWGMDYYGNQFECARGAILSVLNVDRSSNTFPQDEKYCAELVKGIPADDPSQQVMDVRFRVAHYNNAHNHEDVLALFDHTIARLGRQQIIDDLLVTPIKEVETV